MSEIAEVLELLHGGGSGFRAVRASIQAWRDEELSTRAFHRSGEEAERRGMRVLRVSVGSQGSGGEARPAESTDLVRLWFEPPARVRVEVEGRHPSTIVMNGAHEWRLRSEREWAVRGPSRPAHEAVDAFFLFRPWALLPGYLFEPLGGTSVAGRRAIAVRARLRPIDGHRLTCAPGFSWGAEEHLLAVDREQGILLRAASILDGREYKVTEIAEVAFDEAIEPAVFEFTPPPGVGIRTAEEELRALQTEYPLPSHAGAIEGMAAQVDFRVFAPSSEGRPITGQSGSCRDDHFSATYTQMWGDEEHSFDLVQRAADGEEPAADPETGQTRVAVLRDRTHIEARSWTLGEDRLRQVIDSLEPVQG